MAKRKKNSLVANINKRKKSGTSRSKSRSTVSGESYENMEEGWPQAKAKRKTGAKKKGRPAKKKGRPAKKKGRAKTKRRGRPPGS